MMEEKLIDNKYIEKLLPLIKELRDLESACGKPIYEKPYMILGRDAMITLLPSFYKEAEGPYKVGSWKYADFELMIFYSPCVAIGEHYLNPYGIDDKVKVSPYEPYMTIALQDVELKNHYVGFEDIISKGAVIKDGRD